MYRWIITHDYIDDAQAQGTTGGKLAWEVTSNSKVFVMKDDISVPKAEDVPELFNGCIITVGGVAGSQQGAITGVLLLELTQIVFMCPLSELDNSYTGVIDAPNAC